MMETSQLQVNTVSTNQKLEGFAWLNENLEANALAIDSIRWCNHVHLCLGYDMQHEQVHHVEMKVLIQLSTFRHLMPMDVPQVVLSSVQKPLYPLQIFHECCAMYTSDI